MPVIIRIDGAGLDDDIFSIETPDEGEIVWNVTKLLRAAQAGKFGEPITMLMSVMPAPRYDLGFLDKAKVQRFKAMSEILRIPAIAIEAPRENHLRCFCDGQHPRHPIRSQERLRRISMDAFGLFILVVVIAFVAVLILDAIASTKGSTEL